MSDEDAIVDGRPVWMLRSPPNRTTELSALCQVLQTRLEADPRYVTPPVHHGSLKKLIFTYIHFNFYIYLLILNCFILYTLYICSFLMCMLLISTFCILFLYTFVNISFSPFILMYVYNVHVIFVFVPLNFHPLKYFCSPIPF